MLFPPRKCEHQHITCWRHAEGVKEFVVCMCVTHIYMRGDVARPIMVSTVKIEQTGGELCVWGCFCVRLCGLRAGRGVLELLAEEV